MVVVGAFYVSGMDTIFPRVTVNGTEVGGMTEREAQLVLAGSESTPDENVSVTVELPMDCSFTVTGADAGFESSSGSAASAAYEYCHGGGMFRNLLTYLKCLISGKELTSDDTLSINEQAVRSIINQAIDECSALLLENEVTIGEDEITIVKGAGSFDLDADELYELFATALENGETEPIVYEPVSETDSFDMQALYDEIYKEPVNAKYDVENGTALASENGISFDLELAQQLWDEAEIGDTVVIPLIITEPEVKTEDLNANLFADCLSQKSTTLAGSTSARINNITKAAEAINGIILNPGEEFSYNAALGQRTAEAGYMGAGAYANGQVVTEIGGGICQVSSTLYYCALYSNLEITERTCHYFGVSYLPAGLDATVSWPSPDFKFKNNRNYPIKIEAYTDLNSYTVTVKIWGTDEDGSYVEMHIETWATTNGTGATTYRLVYDKNGNLISNTKESDSQYHYHTDDEEEATPSPSTSPSPTPTETPTDTPTNTPTGAPTEVIPPTTTVDPVTPTVPVVTDTPITPTDPVTPVDPIVPTEPVTPA